MKRRHEVRVGGALANEAAADPQRLQREADLGKKREGQETTRARSQKSKKPCLPLPLPLTPSPSLSLAFALSSLLPPPSIDVYASPGASARSMRPVTISSPRLA